ncbi:MAG: 4Fe-4S dicluster domain-containing protein [Candidatus Helarchaeota archaeon]
MAKIKKVIKVYPEKCLDCKLCELSCSITKEGKIFPLHSRIEVIDYSWKIKFPISCYHCEEPSCAVVCPTSAIYRDPKNGLIKVDEKKCIQCRRCTEACPFGAIGIGIDGRIFKCNHCEEIMDGSPQCVISCPHEALEYVEPQDVIRNKREKFAKKFIEELVF